MRKRPDLFKLRSRILANQEKIAKKTPVAVDIMRKTSLLAAPA